MFKVMRKWGEKGDTTLWGGCTYTATWGGPRLDHAPAGVSKPLQLDSAGLLHTEVPRVNAVKVEGLTVML